MLKRIFFLLGLLTGALLLELFQRQLRARLQQAEAIVAERDSFNNFLQQDRQAYYDGLSTEEKINYTIAMAEAWESEDDETEED